MHTVSHPHPYCIIYDAFIVTTRELVKIEGGAKVGTAHLQGKVANDKLA